MAKAPAETDKTIGEWEEEAPLALSESREPTPDYFKPLDGIVPPVAPTEQPTGIHDSITVRPLSVRQSIVQGKQPQLPKKPPVNPSEPGRSRRTRDTGGIFSPQAQFALLAGQEEEPQRLTDALASDQKEEWRAAWQSELTSLAKNNTWVIEVVPEDKSVIGCR